ncbi:hypothetical protein [Nocardia aurea]|uniref:hypothetical protein n=1 Tax=Nocardia aurea TaxID=2144174 RepID=UPI0033B6DFEA
MTWAQWGLLLVIAVPVALILVMIGWPSADSAAPVVGWAHAVPVRRFTVTEAHRAMQLHRECSAIDCPRKEAARAVLVAAGRVVPDPRRGY